MDPRMAALYQEYGELLACLDIDPAVLESDAIARHEASLRQLATVGNVGITVFDLLRREHVFTSYNFPVLFGHDLDRVAAEGNAYFDSRVHPEDHVSMVECGNAVMKFYLNLPKEERPSHKFITEYRILNGQDEYVRIIEQHQSLECDPRGNPWLSLGVMDISPVQDINIGLRACVMNFHTGKIIDRSAWETRPAQPGPSQASPPVLSRRELEILALIETGMLSKEISHHLSISVHTVNTHRQRILEKLNADNSMEALRFARGLGLMG